MDTLKKFGIWAAIAVAIVTVISFWRDVPTQSEMNTGFGLIRADIQALRQELTRIESGIQTNTQNHINHLEHHGEKVSVARESQDK